MPGEKRLIVALFCVSLCSATLVPDGFATLVLPADFSEMVAASQTIVHGRVSDVSSRMLAGRRSIESVVTLEVLTAFKGGDRASVVFRVPNGRVGRYRRITVGAPELAAGDEVILFLEGRAPAVPMPFGLTQGVYRVARTADGRAVVTPLVAADPGRIVRGDPARRPLQIEAFASHVRAMVGR